MFVSCFKLQKWVQEKYENAHEKKDEKGHFDNNILAINLLFHQKASYI